jgi:hypothetical protein
VTRAERAKRLSEAYRIIATELDHHIANGSEWLHLEPRGEDSPPDVVKLRFKVLRQVRDEMLRRSKRTQP